MKLDNRYGRLEKRYAANIAVLNEQFGITRLISD
jgi:hypothetical protein